MKFDPKHSLQKVKEELPSLVLENILMAAVKKGGDRQKLHEVLKNIIPSFQKKPIEQLFNAIQKEKAFSLSKKELVQICKVERLIGRAGSQVRSFLQNEVDPFLRQNKRFLFNFQSNLSM